MRRPSWNKSQAIQQVISLKALLEGSEDDSGARTLRIIAEDPPHTNSNSGDSGKEPSALANALESPEDGVPYRRRDPLESLPQGDAVSSPVEPDRKTVSPRSVGIGEDPHGQMTIFYCGQVNVYEGVSPDKAKTIMQLAASPIHFPPDDSLNGSPPIWPFPCRLQAASDKHSPLSPTLTMSSNTQTEKLTEFSQQYLGKGNTPRDFDGEGQLNRKILLQRYLEKRKDRGRFKTRKDAGPTSSNLEIYLNHQVRTPNLNGQLRKSGGSSPPQAGIAHGTKIVSLSVDLNEEGT